MQTLNGKKMDLSLHIKTIKRSVRFPIHIHNQVFAISKKEGKNFTDILLPIIQKGLKQSTTEKQVFYCQSCSSENSIKKMHMVPVGLEMFVFCEDCIFSESYKTFIRRVL